MSDDDLICSLEDKRYDALLKQDYATFADLCHKDLLYTHSSGVVDTLESYLEKCTAGYYVYHIIEHPIDSITIVNNTAIVIGQMRADITVNGKAVSLYNQCLALWVNIEGNWKFLAYQPTPLPQ